jgi:sugar/nucleoside kinase (ribokinase family)
MLLPTALIYICKMRFPFKLNTTSEFDAVGFGTNAVDFLISVPQYPEFNSKVEISGYVQAAGGEVATTMAGLARLGSRTAYAGRFGSDPAGKFGLRSLEDDGVDVRWAETVQDAATQIAFIVIDRLSGERTVMWQRDDALAYEAHEAPIAAALAARVLHFTPHDADACHLMARAARTAGAVVSADVDNIFDGIENVLPLIDILIMSSDLPGRLIGTHDTENALKELYSRYGCRVAGVTLGAAGSLLLVDGKSFIRTEGYGVPGGCRDTTGAGDAFRAGLLYGLLKEESIEDSARIANAVAALKCREIGARTALPSAAELGQFLTNL